MKHMPAGPVDLYHYLEQDERALASMARSEEARLAHLAIAKQYRELAVAAVDDEASQGARDTRYR